MSIRNGSQLTGVPWDLRLVGHTSATHTFLVSLKIGDGGRVSSPPMPIKALAPPPDGVGYVWYRSVTPPKGHCAATLPPTSGLLLAAAGSGWLEIHGSSALGE